MNKPIARIYQRVSTKGQDTERQDALRADAEAKGYVVVATYTEKESGTKEDRPELQRMLADLNAGDTIIAEHLDRLTRLPLKKAEALMDEIKKKGAKVSVPQLIELPKVDDEGIASIALEAAQAMLLKIALYQCRNDYETRRRRQKEGIALKKEADKGKPLEKRTYKGRKADIVANAKIIELRALGYTIAKVASTLCVSESQVKLILKKDAAAKAAKAA
ncbi:recombinase family protein [Pseudoduganella sp. S-14]|uniref:recombinase family protein n=1 Tax=Pseudoduganella sp. S-14 TaxID=3404065 RepID=UPI003CFB0FC4